MTPNPRKTIFFVKYLFGVKKIIYLCALDIIFNYKRIMEERLIFSEIPTIESICCVLGLNFPESATEFQKACLTLAHLYACIRDYVLKGVEVPEYLIKLADQLNTIQYDERAKQR